MHIMASNCAIFMTFGKIMCQKSDKNLRLLKIIVWHVPTLFHAVRIFADVLDFVCLAPNAFCIDIVEK